MLKLYAFLFIVAILSGVGYGAYYYYNDTQTRIAILRENNAKLETVNKQVTVEFEQYRENVTKEIKRFKEDLKKQQELNNELNTNLQKVQDANKEISKLLANSVPSIINSFGKLNNVFLGQSFISGKYGKQ